MKIKTDHDLAIGFPVVGMVASAGGLDGFKKFFSAMPADSGMAFVLIPHLDPMHESLMVGLLSKLTPMPVVEAQDGMKVAANNVYIIPPNKFMAIAHGQLQLSDPPHDRGWRTSIDFFLRSLAQDQTERAIGIVLSGTGSHGALGVREIKLAGGMTIAQQPETAEYSQMPQNAIATGQIDCVLPPEQMPVALVKYVEQPYLSNVGKKSTPSAEAADLLNQVLTFLQSRTKYDFRSYRKAMVLRRIQRRMGLAQIDSLTKYLDLLHERPEESTALYKDLLISVTAFFRDPEAFLVLQQELIPALIARHADNSPLRVWVPGCATGEEAYSIAMLLLESICPEPTRCSPAPQAQAEIELGTGREEEKTETAAGPSLQIFATDIDDEAIEFARAGIYPTSLVSDLSPERLKRFFTAVDDSHYRVHKRLRDSVVFSHQNLIGDAPFSKLDLISCRNLLIYLEPELQQQVIGLFHFALAADGFLLLGPSETIGRTIDLFETCSKKWRIYRKIGPSRRDSISIPLLKTNEHRNLVPHNMPSELHRKDLKELVERLVLNEYAPAAALINRKFEILYLTGQLVDYLEFPMGELTKDLLAMARAGLRTKLRVSCMNAIRDARMVVDAQARVKRNGRYVHCSITVRPLLEPKEAQGLLLVTFQDLAPWQTGDTPNSQEASLDSPTDSLETEDSALVQQLEFELKSLSEELHGTIEEMESSTEELKTSNEEIMSVNEELQSANEELETSKEELQSLNEELNTVNSQLQDKIAELDQAKDDLINLMSSTEIATIFLDEQLNIKRFTPPTTELLNLRITDIGRPLCDIAVKFHDTNMLAECQSVLETLTPIESEVETDASRYFLRRILPYRAMDHHLGGVVITFVDLTERKKSEAMQRAKDAKYLAEMHEMNERLAAVLDTASDAIITVDRQGVMESLNRVTEELFGYMQDELLGQPISLLLKSINPRQSPATMDKFLDYQLGNEAGHFQETIVHRKDGSTFPVEMTIGRVDHLGLFTVFLKDISERKELQAHLLEIASEEQRRIGQELHDGTQQELTGMTLYAGVLCELLDAAVCSATQGKQKWAVKDDDFKKLKLTAAKLMQGLETAYRHVHDLSHGIMPVQIDAEGLRSAFAELVATTDSLHQVQCHFQHSGTIDIPNGLIATQLYRIAQESINNALQHGKATEIHVFLSQQNQEICLEISDNGIGVDRQLRSNKGRSAGMGLRIMEYRVSIIGGVLQFERNAGQGMTVRCIIPIKEQKR